MHTKRKEKKAQSHNQDHSPVSFPSRSRHMSQVVRALIKAGARVDNQHASRLVTPLMPSSENGHVEVVRALLNAGADPDVYYGSERYSHDRAS